MDTVCGATSTREAMRVERAVRNAFAINRFGHLEPAALEVVMKIFQDKGWKLPTDPADLEPQQELTLYRAVETYVNTSERNRTVRKRYAIDRLLEYFGEDTPLHEIKVSDIRKYRNQRVSADVSSGTINIQIAALSGIFREQVDQELMEFNPCSRVKKLPGKQVDVYISFKDFQKILSVSDWLRPIITMLFYAGMRPAEVHGLDWTEVDFSRWMIVLPLFRTKEGKNENQKTLWSKRVPMRSEI